MWNKDIVIRINGIIPSSPRATLRLFSCCSAYRIAFYLRLRFFCTSICLGTVVLSRSLEPWLDFLFARWADKHIRKVVWVSLLSHAFFLHRRKFISICFWHFGYLFALLGALFMCAAAGACFHLLKVFRHAIFSMMARVACAEFRGNMVLCRMVLKVRLFLFAYRTLYLLPISKHDHVLPVSFANPNIKSFP